MNFDNPLGEVLHVAHTELRENFRMVLREHELGMSKTILERRGVQWVAVTHSERFFEGATA